MKEEQKQKIKKRNRNFEISRRQDVEVDASGKGVNMLFQVFQLVSDRN